MFISFHKTLEYEDWINNNLQSLQNIVIGPVPTYGVPHALRSLSCNLKAYTLQLLSSVYKNILIKIMI